MSPDMDFVGYWKGSSFLVLPFLARLVYGANPTAFRYLFPFSLWFQSA